jgi:DNA-damage-inducible protein J
LFGTREFLLTVEGQTAENVATKFSQELVSPMKTVKTEVVRSRVEQGVKEEAMKILAEQGLTISQAVQLLLREVVAQKTLPLRLDAPTLNPRAKALLESMAEQKGIVQHESSAAFFESLGIKAE